MVKIITIKHNRTLRHTSQHSILMFAHAQVVLAFPHAFGIELPFAIGRAVRFSRNRSPDQAPRGSIKASGGRWPPPSRLALRPAEKALIFVRD